MEPFKQSFRAFLFFLMLLGFAVVLYYVEMLFKKLDYPPMLIDTAHYGTLFLLLADLIHFGTMIFKSIMGGWWKPK